MMQPVADAVGEGSEIFSEKIWSPSFCPTSCFMMLGEMITKLFHQLIAGFASIRPLHGFQKRFEWQSECLFVPAKPPLRYDTIRRTMTGVAIERVTRNSNSRSL